MLIPFPSWKKGYMMSGRKITGFHKNVNLIPEGGDLCIPSRHEMAVQGWGQKNNVNYSKFQFSVCCFHFLGLFSTSLTSV